MAFYAVATIPIITRLQEQHTSVRQSWYADDSSGAGRLRQIRLWWDELQAIGRRYGYFTNSEKTQLLVKPELEQEARQVFAETGIRIVTGSLRYLGSEIGSEEAVAESVQQRVAKWKEELKKLTEIAKTEPHAAYAAISHGLHGRWTYLLRTVPFPAQCLTDLDKVITEELLPALAGRDSFLPEELNLLRLPCRLGGMALPCFQQMGMAELPASRAVTALQVEEIVHQNDQYTHNSTEDVRQAALSEKTRLAHDRRQREQNDFVTIKSSASPALARRLESLSTKGVSSWLGVLPLADHGHHLSKGDFRDALALRYGWSLLDTPASCVCGEPFDATHAMICPRGGFPTIRHNEVRDIVADLLTEVCSDVAVEPVLAPITGEVFLSASTNTANDARADVRARGFWTRAQNAFFDVRVFHPDAASYKSKPVSDLLKQHERRKKSEYAERINNVDRGSFTPLVFTTAGCCAPECTAFIKRLCALLATADRPYAQLMAYVRCRLSFALLRAAIMCIRGARSAYHRPVNAMRELAIVESGL